MTSFYRTQLGAGKNTGDEAIHPFCRIRECAMVDMYCPGFSQVLAGCMCKLERANMYLNPNCSHLLLQLNRYLRVRGRVSLGFCQQGCISLEYLTGFAFSRSRKRGRGTRFSEFSRIFRCDCPGRRLSQTQRSGAVVLIELIYCDCHGVSLPLLFELCLRS